MNRKINEIIATAETNTQPVLSLFLNLKDEDHSYQKIRSILKNAQNDLKHMGKSLDKLDEILMDNSISGSEIMLGTGLKDVNAAIYIFNDKIIVSESSSSSSNIQPDFNFQDTYHIGKSPFIIPLAASSFEDIKALILMRNYTALVTFANGAPQVDQSLPVLDEELVNNFNEQLPQDKTRKRLKELAKHHVKDVFATARKVLTSKDKILVISNELYFSPARTLMESSPWKKSHIIEMRNFEERNLIESKILAEVERLIKKNKMADFHSGANKTRNFRTFSALKKETGVYNIDRLLIAESVIENSLIDKSGSEELNNFMISAIKKGAKIYISQNVPDNFSVDLKNLDDTQIYNQI